MSKGSGFEAARAFEALRGQSGWRSEQGWRWSPTATSRVRETSLELSTSALCAWWGHPERAGIARPSRACGPKDSHLKEGLTVPSPTQRPSGPDPQSPRNSRPLENKPLISVSGSSPSAGKWGVGSRGLCEQEGRGWDSDGGSQGARGKQLSPQAPPSHDRATEWLLFAKSSRLQPPCKSAQQLWTRGPGQGA